MRTNMTFQDFEERTYGVAFWQIYLNGKWIVGLNTLDRKYMDMTITEFDFVADDAGQITCTVDLKEKNNEN